MESLGRQIFSLACLDTARLQPVDKVILLLATINSSKIEHPPGERFSVHLKWVLSTFELEKSISSLKPTFGKFSVFEVETRNSKIGRGNRVLEKEFRFLPITQVGLKEHVPLTIFHSFPINACVPKNRVVESGGHWNFSFTWHYSCLCPGSHR